MELKTGKQYCITCHKEAVVIAPKGPLCKEHDTGKHLASIKNRDGTPLEIGGGGVITVEDDGVKFES